MTRKHFAFCAKSYSGPSGEKKRKAVRTKEQQGRARSDRPEGAGEWERMRNGGKTAGDWGFPGGRPLAAAGEPGSTDPVAPVPGSLSE